MAMLLWLQACTVYRPLDQGAPVPWAQALAPDRSEVVGPGLYRVQPGDKLAQIAARHGVSVTTMAAANNIQPPYVIYPGEVLRLPDQAPRGGWGERGVVVEALPPPPSRPAAEGVGKVAVATLPAPTGRSAGGDAIATPPAPKDQPAVQRERVEAESGEGERYVVGAGDTLASIARRYGYRVGDLIAINQLERPYTIYQGQILTLPKAERRQLAAASTAAVARDAPSKKDQQAAADPASAQLPPRSARGFLWPVRGRVIQAFGTTDQGQQQDGIAIAARHGTAVRATDNGVVVYAGEALRGYGQMVLIRHADGYVSAYAHNSALLVAEGQVVRRGEVIARVGKTGDAKQSQLHFELRHGTKPIDPLTVLVGSGQSVASRG